MDELKSRLQYLDDVTQSAESEESLLKQVDDLESQINGLLTIAQQQALNSAAEKDREAASFPTDTPIEVQKQVIDSGYDELVEISTNLSGIDLQIPRMPSNASLESTRHLLDQASKLGREFDDLTVRSTEVVHRLLQQIAKENEAVGNVYDRSNDDI